MIGIVIREVDFEDVQTLIDGVDEPTLPGQQMHGANAAIGHAAHAVGHFVIDVACREHGSIAAAVILPVEPSLDPSLAIGELAPYDRFHSKSLHASGLSFVTTLQTPEKREGFEFFQ